MRTDKNYTKIKPSISGYIRGLGDKSGNKININDSDFIYNSLVLRQSTSSPDEITVGSAIISSCNFALWNDNGKFTDWDWKNSAVELYLNFGNEKIYMGSFVIVSHKENGNTIKVEALDWLKVLDEHSIGECNITWPADAVDVVNAIATTGIKNMDIVGLDGARGLILPDPGDSEMTNRDAISYIAQLLGKFVLMKSDADTSRTSLIFDWYDTTTAYDAGTTFSHELRTDDITIAAVNVYTGDGKSDVTRGDSSGYTIYIEDNPFVNEDNISDVADRISSSVIGLTFRAGTFSILSNVAVEAGDSIKITTNDNSDIITLATDVTYKPSQSKETIVANAEDAAGDLQIKKSAYVRKIINNELNNPSSPLGSAVGQGGSADVNIGSGNFTLSDSNLDNVSVLGKFSYIYKIDQIPYKSSMILQGQIVISPKKYHIEQFDYVKVNLNGLNQDIIRLMSSQYYNVGAIAIVDLAMAGTAYKRINNIMLQYEYNGEIGIYFEDTQITSGATEGPEIYIPINIYI